MINLAELAATVPAVAALNNLTVIPAVPERGLGHEVVLDKDKVDLAEFVALAARLGAGALYLGTDVFDPDDDALAELLETDDVEALEELAGLPAEALARRGEVYQLTVAFVAGGVAHYREQSADWHAKWEERLSVLFDEDDSPQVRRVDAAERQRQAAELVERLLADPEFRAAKPDGTRQRYANRAAPDDPDWAGWDGVRDAVDQAAQRTKEVYARLQPRLDDLAVELLDDPDYKAASSAGVRKQAAERFLIPHADGFFPPAIVRDELYAKATQAAKNRYRPTLL